MWRRNSTLGAVPIRQTVLEVPSQADLNALPAFAKSFAAFRRRHRAKKKGKLCLFS
jgi:hypothetical protein